MSDPIERQEVLDWLKNEWDGMVTSLFDGIKAVPSALQDRIILTEEEWRMLKKMWDRVTQPEIIRCKDCKHSEHWYRDKRRCFLWHETGIGVFEDGFCNYAERRNDG